jgi:triphosphatase
MSSRKTPESHLSFAIDPDDCVALTAEFGKAGAHWTAATKLLSLYLDTPDSAIGKLGFGFGIRRRGDVSLNDMRPALRRFARGLPGQNGWTTFRHALSVAVPLDGRRLQSVLRSADTKLELIFQIEAQRSFWSLPLGQGHAHLTLEQADITHGAKMRLGHMTVTYAPEIAASVFAFVAKLEERIALRMTGETLALEAYREVGRRDAALPSAIVPRLSAEMSSAAAFQAIARAAIDHFLLAQARIRAARDSEAVHQGRVALRRFSAALRLFSSLTAGEGANALKKDLRPLKDLMRTARELDVRLGELAALAAKDKALPTAPVAKLLKARREKAYDALVAALDAPATEWLLLRLVGWIEAGDWTEDAARAKERAAPIGSFVQRRFNTLVEKFRHRCRGLERAGKEERHRTRIQAKNLRYGIEFLDHLVRAAPRKGLRKRQRAFVGALKHLQSFLGEENDALMAQHYFFTLGQNRDAVPADRTTVAAGKTLAARISPVSHRAFSKAVAKARGELFEAKPFWAELARR